MSDGATLSLTTPLGSVPGFAPRLAQKLSKLGLTNVGRLLGHIPFRHEHEAAESGLGELAEGVVGAARGTIERVRRNGFGRKSRVEAVLMSGDERLDLVFFNQAWMANKLEAGATVRVQGTPKQRGPGLQMANPRVEVLREDDTEALDERLRPVYPVTEGVDSRDVERAIESLLRPALRWAHGGSDPYGMIDDTMPESVRTETQMPSLADAYRWAHRPEDTQQAELARERLVFEELLLLQLGVQLRRAAREHGPKAHVLRIDDAVRERISERLPFTLTGAQQRVVDELLGDLGRDRPAHRLVQGDVGSGKTAVALCAMLAGVATGTQAALMAPTTILAEQHFASISRTLEGSGVRIALLTGATPQADRDAILARLAGGEMDLLIGTHALFSETVRFASLSLAVIDEQHRFGVHQRARLGADRAGRSPHLLVMTATPIPRTVALSIFGDLDVSTIDELPPGRTPIKTRVVGTEQRDEVYGWLADRLGKGEQAYIVAPTIDSDDEASVEALAERLCEGQLRDARVGVVHGRLPRDRRVEVMDAFRAHELDAIIATTVIEVGVDVPNASLILIESAERFGLAQLHQLRGRVGRGERASVCVLIGSPATEDARERLDAIGSTTDGFRLAEKDLEIRGMGDVMGAAQSGRGSLAVADPIRDLDLFAMARRVAVKWIDAAPALGRPEDAVARRRVEKRHGEGLDLAPSG
ncbi:MAG: ATP-dependent DNA helicase RecG [Planctomycetota bacterium]